MRKYYLTIEPYASKFRQVAPKFCKADENGVLWFEWKVIYNLAKSTGLKSKKKRHIIKRFRRVIHQAITDGLKEYEGLKCQSQN